MFSYKNSYTSDIKLGEKYRDQQTGMEGVAESIHFYQHACERVILESLGGDGKIIETSFDSPRLVHIPSGEKAESEKPGGPDRGELSAGRTAPAPR